MKQTTNNPHLNSEEAEELSELMLAAGIKLELDPDNKKIKVALDSMTTMLDLKLGGTMLKECIDDLYAAVSTE